MFFYLVEVLLLSSNCFFQSQVLRLLGVVQRAQLLDFLLIKRVGCQGQAINLKEKQDQGSISSSILGSPLPPILRKRYQSKNQNQDPISSNDLMVRGTTWWRRSCVCSSPTSFRNSATSSWTKFDFIHIDRPKKQMNQPYLQFWLVLLLVVQFLHQGQALVPLLKIVENETGEVLIVLHHHPYLSDNRAPSWRPLWERPPGVSPAAAGNWGSRCFSAAAWSEIEIMEIFDLETKPEASFALSRDWRVFFLQSKRKENLTLVFFNFKSALAGFCHLII